MARHPFGLTINDWTFATQTIGGVPNVAVLTSKQLFCYNAPSGGSQYTDLALDSGGLTPITSITSGDGTGGTTVGEFPQQIYGPDNVVAMWIGDGSGGPRVLIFATDIPDMVVQVAAAFASHTAAVNPHNTGAANLTDVAIPAPASRVDQTLLGWDAASQALKLLPPSAVAGAVLLNPPKVGGVYVGQTATPPDPTQGGSGNPWLQLHQPYSATDDNPDGIQFFATGAAGFPIKTSWFNGNMEFRSSPSLPNRIGFRAFELAEGAGGPSTGRFVEWSTNPTNAALREALLGGYGTGHSTKPGWVEATRILSALLGVAAGGQYNSLSQVIFRGRKTTAGAPTTGSWATGDLIIDSNGVPLLCTAGGTPGTWAGPTAPTAFTDAALPLNMAHGTKHLASRLDRGGDAIRLRGQITASGSFNSGDTLATLADHPATQAQGIVRTTTGGALYTVTTAGVVSVGQALSAGQSVWFDSVTFDRV